MLKHMIDWKSGAVAIALVALVGAGFFLRQQRIAERQAVPAPVAHPWALYTVKVRKGDVSQGFPALAMLSSSDEISIRPQISGVIEVIGPREGNAINKGALLAVIDTTQLRKQLAALQASLAAAMAGEKLQRLELARTQKLVGKGFASLEKRDRLVAALEAAAGKRKQLKAQIAELRTRISYGQIVSPVDGRLVARNQVVGDLAAPGREIYRINVRSGAKVRIVVPQDILADLHVGSRVILTYAGKSKDVWLTRLNPALDALSMGIAEADLDKAPFALPSGARVPARVITRSHADVLILPLSAVARSGDDRQGLAFKVVRDGKDGLGHLLKTPVMITAHGFEGLAVTGDLKPGDEVVSAQEGQLLRLQDKQSVRPLPLPTAGSFAGREG